MKRAVITCLIIAMCLLTVGCNKQSSGGNTPKETGKELTTEAVTATENNTRTEKPTVSPTEAPTDPPTEPPTEKPKDNTWKKLYIDYLNSLDSDSYSGYQLIYIDDDDIPELASQSVSHIVTSNLCWINDGELCVSNISFSGFAYLEKQNRYLCEEGFTGKGYDYIKRINGGDAEDIFTGELCTVPGNEYYRWNDVDYSSQDEYEAAKSRDFDSGSAKTLNNLKSYTDICNEIKEY